MRAVPKTVTVGFFTHLICIVAGIAACLILTGSAPVLARAAGEAVTVTLHGAAGEASGAMAFLEFRGRTWMVDCGSFQPEGAGEPASRDDAAARRNQTLPRDATAARGIFISHAHRDHIGRLPLLVHQGYRGPIYLTEATASIARVMLRTEIMYDDRRVRRWVWSARSATEKTNTSVHWMPECKSARAINARNRREKHCPFHALVKAGARSRPCRKCVDHELARIARLFTIALFGVPVAVDEKVSCTFLPAGHIPGAASISVTCRDGDKALRILFSGDLGNNLSTLTAGPAPAPAADVIFIEATYGARIRAPEDGTTEGFQRDLAGAAAARHVIWIPAFALDRTQKILHQIVIAQGRGILDPGMRVSCPSRTATAITAMYRSALQHRQGWFRPEIEGNPEALSPPGLTDKLTPLSGAGADKPVVLITTAGMMNTATSQPLLEVLLPRPDVDIFLVGWQDPSSPGGQLQAETGTVRIEGRSIPRGARVHNYRCFSGHGDAHDIDEWLASMKKTAVLIVTHGEADALQSRAADLKAKGWSDVRVANKGVPLHFHLSD